MTTTEYRIKRPKPIWLTFVAAATAAYIATTIYYIVAGKPIYILIWGLCTLMWVGLTLPMAARSYRWRLLSWRVRVENMQQLRDLDEQIAAGRMFLSGDELLEHLHKLDRDAAP